MHWRVTKRLPAASENGRRHIIIQMEKGEENNFILESSPAVTRLPDGAFRIDETGEIIRTAGLIVVSPAASAPAIISWHTLPHNDCLVPPLHAWHARKRDSP
ncbi:hypothetical protein NT2_12_01450 [Caenibius tardaugens NBRC 16725]|uniref:Uncharacterized protein n=1 Tax=Caenibius tardaugens NBRC 16725 TaxID=1219035 RepID=U2YQE9_9SPHN|nr:hypothetical protein NT2_12_01450 [Caenibius tardaugens NBRC 16725]